MPLAGQLVAAPGELTFDESEGSTTVLLINRDISTDERRDSQDTGWRGCLVQLERELAR